jgi:hypothetical protein
MAKYDVTYSCGHPGEVTLFGPHSARESKLEWYETQAVCPDCYREQKQAERKTQIEDANTKAASYLSTRPDLPALLGSEKQIAWANTIRAGILADAERYAEALAKAPQPGEAGELVNKLYPIWYAELCSQASAKWWIDHRAQSQGEVMGGRNPIAMFGMVMDGRTPAHTALTLWESWANERPEVKEHQIRARAEYERKQAEYEAAKEAYIKDALSCLERVDWERAIANDNEIISEDGHKIDVVQVNGTFLRIDTIDGRREIEYNGQFVGWLDSRPEVQALNERITEIWIETIKRRA